MSMWPTRIVRWSRKWSQEVDPAAIKEHPPFIPKQQFPCIERYTLTQEQSSELTSGFSTFVGGVSNPPRHRGKVCEGSAYVGNESEAALPCRVSRGGMWHMDTSTSYLHIYCSNFELSSHVDSAREPAHLKFSTVLGTALPNRPMVMRPAGFPAMLTSKKTRWVTCDRCIVEFDSIRFDPI